MRFPIFLILVLVCSCSCLNYVADNHLMGSAQANSPEWFIRVNGQVCQSMGEIGLCSVKAIRGQNITIDVPAHPYSYMFDIACTSFVGHSLSYNILANTPAKEVIPSQKFEDAVVFNCSFGTGSIFASVRFFVVSDKYEPLNKTVIVGNQIITGQHAKYVQVNEGKIYTNKTSIKNENQTLIIESDAGRRSYHGFTESD